MKRRLLWCSLLIAACGSSPAPALDAGMDAAIGIDAGSPDAGSVDAGPPDAGPPDAGPPDAGPPDTGPMIDAGIDAGPPPDVFVLGAPGDNCDMTCGAMGLTCRGRGSVGLDCLQHTDIATCNDPTNWIYRYNPATKPDPYCRGDWGTSEVCTNNYNGSNAFCCKCG